MRSFLLIGAVCCAVAAAGCGMESKPPDPKASNAVRAGSHEPAPGAAGEQQAASQAQR
jgi:hypothetical protein